jgi:hypothetical protein
LNKSRLLALALLVLSTAPVRADPRVLRFTDATGASGVDFRMTSGGRPSKEIVEVNGGGVAMLDYDNDGDLDLFFANGATMGAPERGPGSRLYASRGDGTFRDVTKEVGLNLRRWAMGAAVGDYDADGFDDIYVTCFGPNVLLRNTQSEKGRRFVDVTARAGVGDANWGTSAAFSDLDADGDLDLYVVNYIDFDLEHPPERRQFKGVMVFGGPMRMGASDDLLYENLGDGKFRDVTVASGCKVKHAGYGLGTVILDFDGDHKQDIFVGNDSVANLLFLNRGELKFEEHGAVSGVASNFDGRTQATMGIAVGDVDGNGRPDLFTTNFSSDTNTLHVNLGDGLFEDRTSQYGLAAVSRPFLSWGAGLFDFDLDGDEDLFIGSGHIYPESAKNEMDTSYEQPLLLFERTGKRFVRNQGAGSIFDRVYGGRSIAFGDIDADGDPDVVMTTQNDLVRVFRNDAPSGVAVAVKLEGREGNRHALGSRVELISGDAHQFRWVHGGSYQSVNAPVAYFGLGESAASGHVTVRVTWSDGEVKEHKNVPTGRLVTISRGEASFRSEPLAGRGRRAVAK